MPCASPSSHPLLPSWSTSGFSWCSGGNHHSSSCTGTLGCRFFGLITLVTTPYDLLAKPSMWVLPEWGWCRQLKYQVLSRLEQVRVFTVSRSEKETPIRQGEQWQVRWAWRFIFFFPASTGGSGTDPAAWITHPQGAAPTPQLPGEGRKCRLFCVFLGEGGAGQVSAWGSSHPGSTGVGGGLHDVSRNVESGLWWTSLA